MTKRKAARLLVFFDAWALVWTLAPIESFILPNSKSLIYNWAMKTVNLHDILQS